MENYIAAFTGKTLLATKLIASAAPKHCESGGVYWQQACSRLLTLQMLVELTGPVSPVRNLLVLCTARQSMMPMSATTDLWEQHRPHAQHSAPVPHSQKLWIWVVCQHVGVAHWKLSRHARLGIESRTRTGTGDRRNCFSICKEGNSFWGLGAEWSVQ